MKYKIIEQTDRHALVKQSDLMPFAIYAKTKECDDMDKATGPAKDYGWTYVAGAVKEELIYKIWAAYQ